METNKENIQDQTQKTDAKPPKLSEQPKSKKSLIKVEFIKSPTGVLNLAYHVGEVAEFEEDQAANLVDLGLVKIV